MLLQLHYGRDKTIYQICVQIYGFFSKYTNKNAVFVLKDGILGGLACDFRCYMLRCGVGTSSTIIRLSFGYLSVILRSCLLIGGCKDGILLVRLSLIYGILCAKSEGLFCTRAPHLLLEMYTVHFFGAAFSLHGYLSVIIRIVLLRSNRDIKDTSIN